MPKPWAISTIRPYPFAQLTRTTVFEVDLILPKAELRFTSPATKAKVTIKIPERP